MLILKSFCSAAVENEIYINNLCYLFLVKDMKWTVFLIAAVMLAVALGGGP